MHQLAITNESHEFGYHNSVRTLLQRLLNYFVAEIILFRFRGIVSPTLLRLEDS